MQTSFSLHAFSIQGVQMKTEPTRCVYWYIKNVCYARLFLFRYSTELLAVERTKSYMHSDPCCGTLRSTDLCSVRCWRMSLCHDWTINPPLKERWINESVRWGCYISHHKVAGAAEVGQRPSVQSAILNYRISSRNSYICCFHVLFCPELAMSKQTDVHSTFSLE